MYQRIAVCLCMLIALTANAQTINLRGVVSNSAGKPIANAIVTLAKQKLIDTTGADGAYSITQTTAVVMPMLVPKNADISIGGGFLVFQLPNASPVKVEIFDINGQSLKNEYVPNASAGVYRFNIEENIHAAKLLVIRASLGRDAYTFHYAPFKNGKYTVSSAAESGVLVGGKLAKIAAIDDTVKVTADKFTTKSIPITSYDLQQNITLDSSSIGGKNAPGPSAGCGKALGTVSKSGTYTITSSSKSRTYIIDIPTNYNKDTPYRLIFGMHCMGGSAPKVAGTDGGRDQSAYYYHIKTQADKDNIQCIYVAPQGDAGGTWQGKPDRQFFFDLQKFLKDNLCIDTTRVFSVGFSFGAMFTYALSLEYPKILRAAACNAPANYSMDQPPNQHVPIAYVQTTGTGDGTCPWVQGSSTTNGGKYCLQQHAQDNGCTTTIAEVKLATNGTHVVTEFKGCKDGYPVKFCSHNGVHECNKTDQGSNVDWIPVEFWEFFKRF